ncbi:hypothetical protein CRENPOLYSF2_240005 [Crenothrix polyspora]|uniref:Uncharacterized protein n=1 Tax=Crenothrix polyspora TaxID=360316 RepID=A0A1R4H6H4_9GAMM|nr:hypothetical protein CRENPOLYSF2_240005 [Crenothrix polyspora]
MGFAALRLIKNISLTIGRMIKKQTLPDVRVVMMTHWID